MPRVTRSNSVQEDVRDVESSPEKDDKKEVKAAIAASACKNQHPDSQCVMIIPGNSIFSSFNTFNIFIFCS